MRWIVNVGYATLAAVEEDAKGKEAERAQARQGDKRVKVKLIPIKRLGSAIPWLQAALQNPKSLLIRHHRLVESPVQWGLVTDASPWGLGGILIHRDREDRDFTAMAGLAGTFA